MRCECSISSFIFIQHYKTTSERISFVVNADMSKFFFLSLIIFFIKITNKGTFSFVLADFRQVRPKWIWQKYPQMSLKHVEGKPTLMAQFIYNRKSVVIQRRILHSLTLSLWKIKLSEVNLLQKAVNRKKYLCKGGYLAWFCKNWSTDFQKHLLEPWNMTQIKTY